VLLPGGLNFFMWTVSVGNVWFKSFPVSHKISGDCSTEIQHKRSSVSCMFVDLCITRLFLCNSKHSEHTSLFLHIAFCN
jgi:hypothetical protein